MEEVVSRIQQFLREFDNDKLSPFSEESAHSSIVGNYSLKPEDVFGEVTDWVLNYLEQRKCPYELAAAVAKNVAKELSTLTFEKTSKQNIDADDDNWQNATTLYSETISNIHSVCSSFLDQPDQAKIIASSHSISYATSVFAIRNKRRKMEDRHVIYPDLNTLFDLKQSPSHSYYAVFDGHAGVDAASFAAAHLHTQIVNHPAFITDTVKAIKEAYQKTDENFLERAEREGIKSGCTVVSALIRENTVYLIWLGDSQALLVKQGKALTIMNPHKPDREDERKRIEDLGGYVSHYGTWRVNGNLAVSRALGDPEHKRFIISEPDINIIQLDGTEDFLILACDGLWDGMSAEEVTAALYQYLVDNALENPVETIAAKLVHQSKLQGSDDNITTIVVFLRGVQSIINDAPKFLASFPLVDMKNHSLQLITDCVGNEKSLQNLSITKPNILELNGASSKKSKKGSNVMDFGYSCQLTEQDVDFFAYQNPSSNPIMCNAVNNHTTAGYPPEATALSELPTPPIDDVLASQQFGEFCATELCQGLNLVTSDIKCSSFKNNSHNLSNQALSPICATVDSKYLEDSLSPNKMELDLIDSLQDENAEIKVANKNAVPDEAIGIASTVVSNAIETAVKCVSSNELDSPVSPSQSTQKLNPYAEPFVMKSFFSVDDSTEENKATECIGDTSSSDVKPECDIDCVKSETMPICIMDQIIEPDQFENFATIPKTEEILSETEENTNLVKNTLPPCESAELNSLKEVPTSQNFPNSLSMEINESAGIKPSELCNPEVPQVLTEIDTTSNNFMQDNFLQPSSSGNLDLLDENVVEESKESSIKTHILTSPGSQSEVICPSAATLIPATDNDATLLESNQSIPADCLMALETRDLIELPIQNLAIEDNNSANYTETLIPEQTVNKDSLIGKEVEEKFQAAENKVLLEHIEVPLPNADCQSVTEDNNSGNSIIEMLIPEQIISKDSLLLKEVDEKFKSVGDEILSEHIEVPHTNVDLQSVPAGIPEAEGVTEDIDSDSEKDGGWSYMKGNTVGGDKNASDVKSGPEAKKKPVEKKSFLQNVKKPTLDTRVKYSAKSTIPVEKSKKLVMDKKPSDSKELKDKAKTSKPPVTLSSTLKPNPLEKVTKPVISRVKKEVTVTNSKVSSLNASNKMPRSTLPRNPLVAAKTGSNLYAGANARPKPTLPSTETKSTTRTGNPSLISKDTASNQSNKPNISSLTRNVPNRLASSATSVKVPPVSKPAPVPKPTLVLPRVSTMNAKTKPAAPATKKPISTLPKKTDVKETKNTVNKQISAGKVNPLTSNIRGELVTSTPKTNVSSRRVMPSSDRLLSSKTPAIPPGKAELSKKDIPKKPVRSIIKSAASSKLSKEEIKNKSAKTATTETVKTNDENPCKAVNICEEEKFILETNIKETVTEEQTKTVSGANNELYAPGDAPLSENPEPMEDFTPEAPIAECTSPKIV